MSQCGSFLVGAGVIIKEAKTSEVVLISSSKFGSANNVFTIPFGMIWNVGSIATKGCEDL